MKKEVNYITVGSRATVDAKDTRRADVCGDYLYCYGCGQVLPKEEFYLRISRWYDRYCTSCDRVNQRMYYMYRKMGAKRTKLECISKDVYMLNKLSVEPKLEPVSQLEPKLESVHQLAPKSRYAECVRAKTCIHGSVMRSRCKIKHHKPRGCRLYEEFLGYAYTVEV